MSKNELYDYFKEEYEKPFKGWDFSHIKKRFVTEELKWNYQDIVKKYLSRNVESLLDMDTGGGELLSSFMPLPQNTYATEAYPPNIPIAKERLEPLQVKVIGMDKDEYHSLPFEDGSFDLVINCHGSYDPKEVMRILKKGGIFITQQVGGSNNIELNQALGANDFGYSNWTLNTASDDLIQANFKIISQQEQKPSSKFYDTGSILYYLKAIPWQVSDFSIDRYYDQLVHIHNTIQENGYFEVKTHRFLLVAEK